MQSAPKKDKAGVGARVQQFLTNIGTAGGPIGAPGLFTFGAGNLQEQMAATQMNPYQATQQAAASQGPVVGAPNMSHLAPGLSTPSMPTDFDSGYLHLNVPGSPLPMYGLMASHNLRSAEGIQKNIRAMDQYAILPYMPQTGQLPVDPSVVTQLMSKSKAKGKN
jgi:hypothetical protein